MLLQAVLADLVRVAVVRPQAVLPAVAQAAVQAAQAAQAALAAAAQAQAAREVEVRAARAAPRVLAAQAVAQAVAGQVLAAQAAVQPVGARLQARRAAHRQVEVDHPDQAEPRHGTRSKARREAAAGQCGLLGGPVAEAVPASPTDRQPAIRAATGTTSACFVSSIAPPQFAPQQINQQTLHPLQYHG